MTMRVAGAVLVLVLAVSACGEEGVDGRFGEPEPMPSPTAEQRRERLDDGRWRIWPRSASVQPDTAYRITVYTHCGLDYLLDFDGSFWEVAAAPEPPTGEVLDDPEDEGMILLVERDKAVFVSSQGAPFELERLDGPREVQLCD